MLTIWTAANAEVAKRVFTPAFRPFRPEIPEHKFVDVIEEAPAPVPAPGGVILVCGNKALDVLRRAGTVHKGRTLTSMREKPIKAGAGHYLVTYDPSLVGQEPDKQETINWDTQLAVRIIRTGSTTPVLGEYKWVNTYQPMIEWIEAQHAKTGKPVDVACDIETMGFYPWYPAKDIISISFTAKPGTAEVLYLGPQKHPIDLDPKVPLYDHIRWLLTSPKVRLRLANGKYDLVWIAVKWGIECTNFKFDTMLVGSLLDENRSNSLNTHAKHLTPIGGYDDSFNDKYDKGRMEAIPAGNDLLTYAGGDTDAVQRVADVLRDDLKTDGQLANFYVKVLHPAARAFEKIERRGVLADAHKFHQLRDDLRKAIDEAHKKTLDALPHRMRIKYRDRIDEQLAEGKSPMLPKILKEFFFTPHGLNLRPKEVTAKTGEPSLAKSHLRQFATVPAAAQMIEALTEADSAMKTLSTFVDGFLKHLRPDGKFHPTYFLAHATFEGHDDGDGGTVTGRTSAKDPPFQVIPKKTKWAKRIRECFPAPEGKVTLSADYVQGELKVVACVAGEKKMLQAYKDGLDLHAVTGAKLAQVDLSTFNSWKYSDDKALVDAFEKNRTHAKPANFGLLYGMSAEGLMAYAWATYGLKLTLEEATVMRNAFFELYPGLLEYHERQRKLARQFGAVRSPLGRIRHLPTIYSRDREIRARAERQSINSPIQSCLSDMMLWAIAEIEREYPNGEIEIVGMIHDALIAYIPDQDTIHWASQVTQIMATLPFDALGWQPQLTFTADAEVGPNLAELKKLKLTA
jgi:DNA polymerase I-like protein with 3'-5' exonuclease and polymerase domains